MAKKDKVHKVILIGGGGHARVLRDILSMDPACIIEGYADNAGDTRMDIPYLGKDEDLLARYHPDSVELVNAVGSVAPPLQRRKVFEFFKDRGYRFRSVIHSRAIISPGAVLGEGVSVSAGVVINTGVRIGENVIINTAASIDHDTVIGQHTHVAPGVTISGGVVVGQGAHIGVGATVVQDVRVGDGVFVAAGAVVTMDVPAHVRVRGVPAKVFESRD